MRNLDGFVLDQNKFDILPLDDLLGKHICSKVDKERLKDAGYLG